MKKYFIFLFAAAFIVSAVMPAMAADKPAKEHATVTLPARELVPIILPKPETDGGMPLMQALSLRQSIRSYSAEKLPPQVLSNLLWAAFGINRPNGMRTAPTAGNSQKIDIYVAMAEGVYLYNAKVHQLDTVAADDVRSIVLKNDADVPVDLIYVADISKEEKGTLQAKIDYGWAETGAIAQNVHLFCASQGLATVIHTGVDTLSNSTELAKILKLNSDQMFVLHQVVGYPKKK